MGVDAGLDDMTGRVAGKVAFVGSSTLMNLFTSQVFRNTTTRAACSNNQQPIGRKTNA
jgi:hypothetical protein